MILAQIFSINNIEEMGVSKNLVVKTKKRIHKKTLKEFFLIEISKKREITISMSQLIQKVSANRPSFTQQSVY